MSGAFLLQEVISLNAWQVYLVNVAYIGVACALNILGAKIIDKTSQLFSLSSLFPFVLFVILGLSSPQFSLSSLIQTSERKTDVGLYLSVLIWATCGYEYSGFLAGTELGRSTSLLEWCLSRQCQEPTAHLPMGDVPLCSVDAFHLLISNRYSHWYNAGSWKPILS